MMASVTPGHAAASANPAAGNATGKAPSRRQSNQAVLQRLAAPPGLMRTCSACAEDEDKTLQTKLGVSEPGDALEREADDTADRVMRMADAAAPPAPLAHHHGEAPQTAPESVHQTLRGDGEALDAPTRAFMEPRLGHDLGGVRVHRGAQASQSARDVQALAYTVGSDIVFGNDRYQPHSDDGRRLLAHELAHVVQQAGGVARQIARAPTTTPADPFANEKPDERTRRLAALAAGRNALARLSQGLQSGYLWPGESATGSGDVNYVSPFTRTQESQADRTARLQLMRTDLQHMLEALASAPVPQAWLAPAVKFAAPPPTAGNPKPGGGGTAVSAGSTPADTDADMFYGFYAQSQSRKMEDVFDNWNYMNTAPLPTKAIAQKPVNNAIETGTLIVVEDPVGHPLDARLAGNNDGQSKATTIYNMWQDDLGYFYIYDNQRHYLKARPDHY
jgi:hypothetical protein